MRKAQRIRALRQICRSALDRPLPSGQSGAPGAPATIGFPRAIRIGLDASRVLPDALFVGLARLRRGH
jgi:hypothetical protein